jgi:glucosylglycerate phosphorylase
MEPELIMTHSLKAHLVFLYGDEIGEASWQKLQALMARYEERLPVEKTAVFSHQDSILITYGDQVQEPGSPPLQSLAEFCEVYLNGRISTIHLLPFYPYTSDDGFSVVDYQAVNPELGEWDDVTAVGNKFRLMFDAVINHISAESDWFQRFLQDDPIYKDYFVCVESGTDLSAVFRPRALPLLMEVDTPSGQKLVWTTFSPDQVDLNYANPAVLLDVIETLLFYVEKGANYIRLDAIGFMWKEVGTSSLHLPQTHRIIQLMRSLLNDIAPHVALITETNVPHKDNISYFGDGTNEAQMVYNFSLPPLTLHAFHNGDATTLSTWASSLTLPSKKVTFFNFLASHDGIGVTPARSLLDDAEIEAMAARVEANGGFVSYKNNSDGSQSAYELNINYLDALCDPTQPDESLELIAKRFLAAQAIMLALRGIPGIYFHSLLGSRNWREGAAETGRNRTINREKLQRERLDEALSDSDSLRYRVFNGYVQLLNCRYNEPAFHPTGEQRVAHVHPAVFAVWRGDENGRSRLLCLQNVSNSLLSFQVPIDSDSDYFEDIIAGERVDVADGRLLHITLAPYQVMWLKDAGTAPRSTVDSKT